MKNSILKVFIFIFIYNFSIAQTINLIPNYPLIIPNKPTEIQLLIKKWDFTGPAILFIASDSLQITNVLTKPINKNYKINNNTIKIIWTSMPQKDSIIMVNIYSKAIKKIPKKANFIVYFEYQANNRRGIIKQKQIYKNGYPTIYKQPNNQQDNPNSEIKQVYEFFNQ